MTDDSDPKHVTRMSQRGQDWLAALEGGHVLTAYQDSKGVWTIGSGLTFYPKSGRRVRQGDRIGLEWAKLLFADAIAISERGVDAQTRDDLAQHEFDALVSFAYNVGIQAYGRSTLAHLVNARAAFSDTEPHFLEWHFSGGKAIEGLLTRRVREAAVYRGLDYRDQGGELVS